MRRSIAAALLFWSAAACSRKAPAAEAGAAPIDAAARQGSLVTPRTTDPTIALGNLDASVRGRQALAEADPNDVTTVGSLIDLLLARGQFRGSISDYERAEAIADDLVRRVPISGAAHLSHASTLGTFHLFARALSEIDAAAHAPQPAPAEQVARARAVVLVGQGLYDEAEALGLWRHPEALTEPELVTAAVVAADRGRDAESEALFDRARAAYRDVSPLPVAWADFQRGSVLERRGERARARPYFAEAEAILPPFAHACVHLAALEPPERARSLLEPLAGRVEDPQVDEAYADALQRLGRKAEAAEIVERVRARYEDIVARHPEAFADHAASFYMGLGNDPARALELAKLNAANRTTDASVDLWVTAALAAGDHAEACRAAATGAAMPYASAALRATLDALRGGCEKPSRRP